MELIELAGTTSSNFFIGSGKNRAEFRVINGKLFFRNNGESGFKVLPSLEELNRPLIKKWAPNIEFKTDEVITYDGTLYIVNTDHISNFDFNANINKYTFLSEFDGVIYWDLAQSGTTGSLSDLNLLLTKISPRFIYITKTESSVNITNPYIILPDASNLNIGHEFIIYNNSPHKINIKTNSENNLYTLRYTNIGNFKYIKQDTTNLNTLKDGIWAQQFYLTPRQEQLLNEYPQIFEWQSNREYHKDTLTLAKNRRLFISTEYHNSSNNFDNDRKIIGGGSGDIVWKELFNAGTLEIVQAHNFKVGEQVFLDDLDGTWKKAKANTMASYSFATISEIIDINRFYITYSGIVNIQNFNDCKESTITETTLTPGRWYFTSSIENGKITFTENIYYSNVIGLAIETTKLLVLPYRGSSYGILTNSQSSALELFRADRIFYKNNISGLIAGNVQEAIDEVENRLDTAQNQITSLLSGAIGLPVEFAKNSDNTEYILPNGTIRNYIGFLDNLNQFLGARVGMTIFFHDNLDNNNNKYCSFDINIVKKNNDILFSISNKVGDFLNIIINMQTIGSNIFLQLLNNSGLSLRARVTPIFTHNR